MRRSGERDGSNLEQLCRQRGWCRSPPVAASSSPERGGMPIPGNGTRSRSPVLSAGRARGAVPRNGCAGTRPPPPQRYAQPRVCLSVRPPLPSVPSSGSAGPAAPGAPGTAPPPAPAPPAPRAPKLRGSVEPSAAAAPLPTRAPRKRIFTWFSSLYLCFFFPQKYIYIFSFFFSRPLFFFFFYSAVVAGNYLHLKTQRLVPRTSLRGSIEAALPPGG